MQNFIPQVVDRSRGDFVESVKFNDQNRDLYADYSELFQRNLSLYAKSKVLSVAFESMAAGFEREAKSQNLPVVNVNSDFIFPDNLKQCAINPLYGEITSAITSSVSVLIDDVGEIREGIDVRRSSDNFVFTQIPNAVTETDIQDAVRRSELPYIMRAVGVHERLSLRLDIDASFASMNFNVVEVVPFPMIGGPEIRDFDIVSKTGQIGLLVDPAGSTINLGGSDPRPYYVPNRFITLEQGAGKLSANFRSSLYLPNQNTTMAGIMSVNVSKVIFEPSSYIGFIIPAVPGQKLMSIKPILKWCNTWSSGITFKVYDDRTKFLMASNDYVSTFTDKGIGFPVKTDKDLFVLAEVKSDKNLSPQLVGFDYEISTN